MPRNREDDKVFSSIAKKYGIDASEVKRIVNSFFDILPLESRKLPFNTPTRIFTKDKFEELSSVYQIPYIGRLGPVYSRYLLWRKNESELIEQTDKSSLKKETSKQKAERIAQMLIYGSDSTGNMMEKPEYKRVWIVKQNGKSLARQVIPINDNKENVQD